MSFYRLLKSSLQTHRERWVTTGFMTLALALALTGVWAWREYMTSPPYVSSERYPVRGIDISAHNGMMNLDAAREGGIEFAFIKASEGVTFRDDNFRLNYAKAKHAGLKIGAYHFFRFDRDGVAQAVNFLEAIGRRNLDLGVAIDVESHGNPEVPKEKVVERLSAMTDYLNLRGYRVMFYSNREGYYDYLAETFKGFPLWICAFTETPIMEEWTFWQYDHHGRVAGISGDVDLNAFCGNREEWEDFLNGDIWPYTRDA